MLGHLYERHFLQNNVVAGKRCEQNVITDGFKLSYVFI